MLKSVLTFIISFTILIPALSSGQDLKHEQIISDYNAYMAAPENQECMKLIKPMEIKVTEMQREESFNTVTLLVTSEWIGASSERFYQGPCLGFDKSMGKRQTTQRVLYYELKEAQWVLTGLR